MQNYFLQNILSMNLWWIIWRKMSWRHRSFRKCIGASLKKKTFWITYMQLGREKIVQWVLPSRRLPLPLLTPLITASFGASHCLFWHILRGAESGSYRQRNELQIAGAASFGAFLGAPFDALGGGKRHQLDSEWYVNLLFMTEEQLVLKGQFS